MKAIIIAFLFAAPLHAQSLPRIALYTSAALDLHSTWSSPNRELNPIAGQSKARQAAVLISTTVFADWMAAHVKNEKLRWIVTGVHTAAAIWNLKTTFGRITVKTYLRRQAV